MTSAISGVSSMVNSLFSKIDTSNLGYIDKAGLKSAFDQISTSDSSDSSSSTSVDAIFTKLDSDSDGKITKQEMTDGLTQLAAELDSQFNQSRINGTASSGDTSGYTKDELTSMIDELGSSDSKRTALMSSIVYNFEAADTNGDGKVSNEEAMTYDQTQQTSSATASSSTSGYTKDELSSLIEELGDSDSKRTTLMSSIVSNFTAADTDGNGKVSDQEAMAYEQSMQTSATSSTGSTGATVTAAAAPPPSGAASGGASSSTTYDDADTNQDGTVSSAEQLAYDLSHGSTESDSLSVMKKIMQLAQAYGITGTSSSEAASSSISAIA
ncbi:MAG: EF-hand domain-containing protein [Burkholderiaceae bacterium]|nr:EF-hand domain-containing protein [Burkholderiaceae bacterium]